MSIYAMGPVWKADLKPNHKFVLLAYADSAREDGTKAWPGWDSLIEMTGYSRSTIASITKELIALGVLVQTKRGRKGQRAEYTVALSHPLISGSDDETLFSGSDLDADRVQNPADRVQNPADRVQPVGPLPSSSPVLSPVLPSRKARTRDFLWESFVEVHGEPATGTERGKFNAIVKKLREADVDGDEYPLLCQGWKAKHGLEPGPATVSERVGEIRHFIAKGPIVAPTPKDVARHADRQRTADLIAAGPVPLSEAQRAGKDRTR